MSPDCRLVVGNNNGRAVRLRDVARIFDSVQTVRSADFINGKPCVILANNDAELKALYPNTRRNFGVATPQPATGSESETSMQSCLGLLHRRFSHSVEGGVQHKVFP
jgi:hypothetical protein